MEKWVDIEVAQRTDNGRKLLEAIEKREPIHTSVACWQARELAPNAEGYKWVARISKMDHDAILLGEPGAATPEQGVGLMVNVADAKELAVNAGVLGDGSYTNRYSALGIAAARRWGENAWVQDFDDTTAIVRMRDGESKAISYTMTDSKAVFADDDPVSVKREESWVANMLAHFRKLGVNSDPTPEKPSPEAVKMDKTELEELLNKQTEAITANTAALVGRIDKLEEANAELVKSLQANAEATNAPMREVVAKVIGELAANKLDGNELKEAFDKLKVADPLTPGFDANADAATKGVPKDGYFN